MLTVLSFIRPRESELNFILLLNSAANLGLHMTSFDLIKLKPLAKMVHTSFLENLMAHKPVLKVICRICLPSLLRVGPIAFSTSFAAHSRWTSQDGVRVDHVNLLFLKVTLFHLIV